MGRFDSLKLVKEIATFGSSQSLSNSCEDSVLEAISRGERPFIDILQDRRYWVIHIITIPSLFLAGVIFVLSGFVYKLFGVPNFNQYFYNDNTQISLINDRFSVLNEIEDL
jgi:photosystem II cytochrome b559 subunit alpha